MVWWFLKRRSQGEVLEPLEVLQANLRNSFGKIRLDIRFIRDWMVFADDKGKVVEQRLKAVEDRLEELGEVLSYMQRSQHLLRGEVLRLGAPAKEGMLAVQTVQKSMVEGVAVPREGLYAREGLEGGGGGSRLLSDLTETQKGLLLRIGTLLRESGQEWVSCKALADEFYSGKEYGDVRSTLSEYVSVLVDANVVRKQRRGKQTYVALTGKGKDFFQGVKKPMVKEIKKRE